MKANDNNNNTERRLGNLQAAVVFLLSIFSQPSENWAENEEAYRAEAKKLSEGFITEFANDAPETLHGDVTEATGSVIDGEYVMQEHADQTATLATMDEGTEAPSYELNAEQELNVEAEIGEAEAADPNFNPEGHPEQQAV